MRRLVVEVLVLLGLLVAAGAYLTQPVLPGGGTTVQQGADPRRLEGHVRVLSERFSPRGDKNLKNLDAAAEYIADALRAAGGEVSDQRYSSDGYTYRNFIAVVGRIGGGRLVRVVKTAMRAATRLPVESINAPGFIPGIDFSDHLSYWEHGYPAVMVTDTAFYRNPRYHTSDDTPDTLDYERMALVVDGVVAAVRALTAG